MDTITLSELRTGETKLVLVTHNETCFESNDSKQSIQIEGDNTLGVRKDLASPS